MNIAGLLRRIALMIGRGRIAVVDDSPAVQSVQVEGLAGEVLPDVEKLSPYGFTSVPLPGAECVILCPTGMRENAVAVVVEDRRFRLKGLAGGEVALYTDEGDRIVFRRGNRIEVLAGAQVDVTAPLVKVEATDVTINASSSILASTSSFTVNADKFSVTATGCTFTVPQLTVTGDILDSSTGSGKTMASMRSIFNAHTHVEHDVGGNTDAPTQKM